MVGGLFIGGRTNLFCLYYWMKNIWHRSVNWKLPAICMKWRWKRGDYQPDGDVTPCVGENCHTVQHQRNE